MSETVAIERGDVIIAEIPAPRGRAIRKRRPYVVLSPDDLNAIRFTYLVAPLTTENHPYRYRVRCEFAGRAGHVVLDQLQVIDSEFAGAPAGKLAAAAVRDTLERLREMFAE